MNIALRSLDLETQIDINQACEIYGLTWRYRARIDRRCECRRAALAQRRQTGTPKLQGALRIDSRVRHHGRR